MFNMNWAGKAFFLVGGQWGSEGKGAAAAWLATQIGKNMNVGSKLIVTTNAGAQAGHTSVHDDKKRVVFHLPTAPLVLRELGVEALSYLNAGSIIDPIVLEKEIKEHDLNPVIVTQDHQFHRIYIHPNAAVITDECRDAEMTAGSAQTKIASTRKGVGEALSRKVLRSGVIARDFPYTRSFMRRIDLNKRMQSGASVLVEVPQGYSLGVNGKFYPHCTSRECTVQQAMADAQIHPSFYGASMLVIRTYPIRVGNIVENGQEVGNSGRCYPDQHEIKWEDLGVEPEITTVTKRVRRVFTFSDQQLFDAMQATRPSVVYLTFCDYKLRGASNVDMIIHNIGDVSRILNMPMPMIVMQNGPTTKDARPLGRNYND